MENEEIKNDAENKEEETKEVIEKLEETSSNLETKADESDSKLEETESNVTLEKSNVKAEDSDIYQSEEITNEQIKENTLLKKVFSSILDQSLIIALSSITLIVFDFLIKFVGYIVVMPLGVLLIIYFIINSLYVPILKNTKFKKTLGEKVFSI